MRTWRGRWRRRLRRKRSRRDEGAIEVERNALAPSRRVSAIGPRADVPRRIQGKTANRPARLQSGGTGVSNSIEFQQTSYTLTQT